MIRGEPPDQAIELDRKMLQAWDSHHRRIVCHNVVKPNSNVSAAAGWHAEDSNQLGFNVKIANVTDAILTVAREHHPRADKPKRNSNPLPMRLGTVWNS